jgi:hypothetical protein
MSANLETGLSDLSLPKRLLHRLQFDFLCRREMSQPNDLAEVIQPGVADYRRREMSA